MRSEQNVRTTLGAICERQGGAIQTGPFGSQLHAADYTEAGTPVVMPADIVGGRISISSIARVGAEHVQRLSQHQLRHNDIVFSRRGDVTRFARVSAREVGWLCGTGCLKVRVGSGDLALPEWIALALGAPKVKEWLVRHAVGATMPNLNTAILSAVPLELPPLEQQLEAVKVCFALDDRIDLLRQTNATLESIAHALFKSWFIDFDPVRAKAEGREPEGMDAATATLFPAEFEESALGLIPKGWCVGTVRDVCSIFDSRRVPLSGKERAERRGAYPYYGAAALMDYVDDFIFDGVYLLLGEDGSVTNADGTPITQYVWGRFWVNNHAHVLQGANGVLTEHLMLAIRGVDFTPYVTGAVQAKLNQGNLFRIPFLLAGSQVPEAFGSVISPLFERLRANSDQVGTLTELRDTLLPRLVSGRLHIPEAQAQLEEAIV